MNELLGVVTPNLASPAVGQEQTMELIQEDECLEVTPECVRMRKVDLSQLVRSRKRKEG